MSTVKLNEPPAQNSGAPATQKSLTWDAERVPEGGEDDTQVTEDGRTVIRTGVFGVPYLVRTRESITRESGPMSWRIKLEGWGGVLFPLGVVSAQYAGTEWNDARVWMTSGDCDGWMYGRGQKQITDNEMEQKNYWWKPDDIVEMSFDPITKLLTAKVDGKPGWSTTRRLKGEGLDEVHPCMYPAEYNTTFTLLSCTGTSKQEYEDQLQSGQDAAPVMRMLSAMMQEMSAMRAAQQKMNDELSKVQKSVANLQTDLTIAQRDIQDLKRVQNCDTN